MIKFVFENVRLFVVFKYLMTLDFLYFLSLYKVMSMRLNTATDFTDQQIMRDSSLYGVTNF